jgi:hypothetical protein
MMGPGADGRVMVERDTLCAEGAAGGPYYDYFYSPYPPHNRTTGCSICTEAPWQWSASITGSTNAGTCGGFPPALPVCSRLNQDIVLTFDFTGAIVTLLRNFVDPNIMCAWSSAQYTPVCFAGNPGVGNSVFYFYNIDGGGGSVTWALRYANGGGFTMNTLWSVDETPISCLTAKSLPLVSNQLPCSSFTDPVVVSPV